MTEIYLPGMISPIKVMMSSRGSRVAFLCISFREKTRKATRPASSKQALDSRRRLVGASMARCQWSPPGQVSHQLIRRQPVSHDVNCQLSTINSGTHGPKPPSMPASGIG